MGNHKKFSAWRPARAGTPLWRVWTTLKGPERSVDLEWWRDNHGAEKRDVSRLSDEEISTLVSELGLRLSGNPRKALEDKVKSIMGWDTDHSTYRTKSWDEMSPRERGWIIEDIMMTYAEVGVRMPKSKAEQMAKDKFSSKRVISRLMRAAP